MGKLILLALGAALGVTAAVCASAYATPPPTTTTTTTTTNGGTAEPSATGTIPA